MQISHHESIAAIHASNRQILNKGRVFSKVVSLVFTAYQTNNAHLCEPIEIEYLGIESTFYQPMSGWVHRFPNRHHILR